jgi:hypothetical protein
MRTTARDTATRAASGMRTVRAPVRHAFGMRRLAMIAGRNEGVRRWRDALNRLACRCTAHGKEREQASKQKTAQKSHASGGEGLAELMRIIISQRSLRDAPAAAPHTMFRTKTRA